MSAIRNGVDIDALTAAASAMKSEHEKAEFEFHAETQWLRGARSRTKIRRLVLESDEPTELLGSDTAPNAIEMVLAALGSCLAVGFAYSAAARGINLESLEFDVRGDLDLQGFLGLSDRVRPGFQDVQVVCRLKSDASRDKIEELFKHVIDASPMIDIIRNPVSMIVSMEEPK